MEGDGDDGSLSPPVLFSVWAYIGHLTQHAQAGFTTILSLMNDWACSRGSFFHPSFKFFFTHISLSCCNVAKSVRHRAGCVCVI